MALVRKELVRPDKAVFAGDDAFRFGHILIRDAVYDSIAKQLRAQLHEGFADWLEREAGDRITEYEEILGYHLEQAYGYREQLGPPGQHTRELARRAAARLASAGERARARGDASAAVNLLGRAVSLLAEDDSRRPELLTELGTGLKEQGELPQAEAVLEEAAAKARRAGDVRAEWRARVQRAYVSASTDPQGFISRAHQEIREARAALEALGDDLGLARMLFLESTVHLWQGQMAAAETARLESVAHALRAGSEVDATRGLGSIAPIAIFGRMPVPDGVRSCREAIDQLAANPVSQAFVRQALGLLHAMQGRFGEARELIEAGRNMFEELGQTLNLATSAEWRGWAELLADRPEAAEVEFRDSCRTFEEIGDRGYLSTRLAQLAEAVHEQGRHQEACQLADASEDAADSEDFTSQVWLRIARAKALAHLGHVSEAELVARAAIGIADPTDNLSARGDAWLSLAEVLRLGKRPEDAAEAATAALALYEQKDILVSAAKARTLLDELQRA